MRHWESSDLNDLASLKLQLPLCQIVEDLFGRNLRSDPVRPIETCCKRDIQDSPSEDERLRCRGRGFAHLIDDSVFADFEFLPNAVADDHCSVTGSMVK